MNQLAPGELSVQSSPVRIHVLGLAHTRATNTYSGCAFTSITRTFCRMMKSHGYTILYYGTPGSDVACDEMIPCLSEEEFLRYFGENEDYQFQYSTCEEGWVKFNERCCKALRERIRGREIVVASYGSAHRFLVDMAEAISVDAHFGHTDSITKYTVYPSKSWRAFVYGNEVNKSMKKYHTIPYWDDAVIYHYLKLDDYPFVEEKDDYVVFIGRLNYDKGVYQVVEACEQLGIPLKVAGAPRRSYERKVLEFLSRYSMVDYLGTVDADERAELVSRAKCLLCPTLYHEAFGLVAIEAMAMGTPVIATDWGAFSETVIHGKTGFLVGYYSEWLHALRRIDRIAPSDCRKWIETNFTTDVVFDYYDHLFHRILAIESAEGNKWYSADLHDDRPISQTLIYPWVQ